MSDPCCFVCRTPTGICASKGACDHHRLAQAQDEADARARRTIRDPTAAAAIANVMRARRNPKRPRT